MENLHANIILIYQCMSVILLYLHVCDSDKSIGLQLNIKVYSLQCTLNIIRTGVRHVSRSVYCSFL